MSKNRIVLILLAVLLVLTVALPVAATPDVIKKTRVEDFRYRPRTQTLDLSNGDQAGFKNFGPSVHTVTSDTGVFDSGNMAVNALFLWTPTAAGTYNYHCTIHPSMTGTLTVVP